MASFQMIVLGLLLSATLVVSTIPEKIKCPSDLADVVCYRIFVPLDHANPNTSVRIPILYGINTPSVPFDSNFSLVAIPGGPGGDFLSTGNLIKPFTTTKYANQVKQQIVFIDPRGTGNASVLTCPSRNKTSLGFLTTVSRLLPIRDCLQQLGPQVVHYSTVAVVKDLEIIRKAIGVKQFDLYGVSYGGFMAQAYSLYHPNSVRSMLLDSPRPLRRDIYEIRDYSSLRRIYNLKLKKNTTFDFDVFTDNTKTVLTRLRTSMDLRRRIGLIPQDIYYSYKAVFSEDIKAINDAAVNKNYKPLTALRKKFFDPQYSRPVRATSISIRCNDLINLVPWAPDASFEERIVSLFENVTIDIKSNTFAPFSLGEAVASVSDCTAFPFAQLPREGIPKQLPQQRKIPALVLYGDEDRNTPLELVDLLDPFLQSKVAKIKGGGHVIAGANITCSDKLLTNFIVNKKVDSFTACE